MLLLNYLTAILQRAELLWCSMDMCLIHQLLYLHQLSAFWELTMCFDCNESYHAICMLGYAQITAQIWTMVFNRRPMARITRLAYVHLLTPGGVACLNCARLYDDRATRDFLAFILYEEIVFGM